MTMLAFLDLRDCFEASKQTNGSHEIPMETLVRRKGLRKWVEGRPIAERKEFCTTTALRRQAYRAGYLTKVLVQ